MRRTRCVASAGGRAAAPRLLVVLGSLSALGLACGESDIVLHARPDEPVEIELALGEERVVAGTTVRVRFAAVEEDSRCPVDVTCVWEGDAAVRIVLAVGDGAPTEAVLHTALEPERVDLGGVRATLLEVRPRPREGQRIEEEDYVVLLRVEAIEG